MVNIERKLIKTNKIDIGCGNSTKEGFSGIDIVDFGQDIIWDVRFGLPFPDESIDEIYSSHFIEHLSVTEIDDFINEVIRVSKVGVNIEFRCPHAETDEAYFSCHTSLWDEKRIRGICIGQRFRDKHLDIKELGRNGISLLIKLTKICKN